MSYQGHIIVELTGATANCEIISIVKYGNRSNPDLTQLFGDSRIWLDFNERARKFDLSMNYFTNYEDFTGCIKILEDDNEMIFRARTTDGNYNKYNGVTGSYTVGYQLHNGVKQLDHRGSRWLINKIVLLESE